MTEPADDEEPRALDGDNLEDENLEEDNREDDNRGDGDGEEREESDERDRHARSFIVGVGASAGGIEALGELLKNIKIESMAVVVVQHLAPDHESMLPEVLGRATKAEVLLVKDGVRLEPGKVYVTPPNAELALLKGVIHVMTPPGDERNSRQPIDYFFRSLAEDQGQRAIGIVLSGSGSDGTFGMKAIKEAGGITFAQDPTTARFDGMPRSAIDSGFADFSLAPEAIADELAHISAHPYLTRTRARAPHGQENVAKLVVMMRSAFGTDFTYYKPSTIDRRIERRMALHKIERFDDYLKLVGRSGDELRLLYRDMLIGVTGFFRDREPFEQLKLKVFPKLLENKETGASIRVWVPACSTGEEAYSIAIALLEFLGDRASDYRIQIFGTDVDDRAIAHARRGIYLANLTIDVSPERLRQFFVKRDNEYQVNRRVRDMVVFSTQNVTRDAPFSRLDLVSCRNLLIYLLPAMQRKVLRILHYALNPTGFLLLGTSETVGDSTMFALVDRKSKIYAKKPMVAHPVPEFGALSYLDARLAPPHVTADRTSGNLASVTDRKLLDLFAPPGVVVNEDLDVLHIRGRTGPFLDPAPGAPSFNLLRIARPELHVDLRRAIDEAKKTNERVTVTCRITDDGATRSVNLEVVPLPDSKGNGRCLLILFHALARPEAMPSSPPGSAVDHRVEELERDLVQTKEYLQATIEELESGSEELKSSNEELQSANEELQSTNEELETSKEELQSANEELTTVNDELQNRMLELQLANDDLYNVLSGIGEAIVIVDMDARLRRFTHAAERLLKLVPTDIGRSVNQLNSFVIGEDLERVVSDVIERLVPVEREVRGQDGSFYVLRVTPYRTLDHSIRGAVIVLDELDRNRRAQAKREDVAHFADDFLAAVAHPLLIIDERNAVVWFNASFAAAFGVAAGAVLHADLETLAGGRLVSLAPLVVEVRKAPIAPTRRVPMTLTLADGSARDFTVGARGVTVLAAEAALVLISFESKDPPR